MKTAPRGRSASSCAAPSRAETRTGVILDLYRAAPIAGDPVDFDLPQIVPQDATHETGRIGLFTADYLTLRVDSTDGLTQTNADRFSGPVMPAPPADPHVRIHSAFRYISRPASAAVTVTRRIPETTARVEHGARIGLRKQILASRVEFNLTGAARPMVSLALPEGYLPTEVAASFLADWYVDGSGRRIANSNHRTRSAAHRTGRRLFAGTHAPRSGRRRRSTRSAAAARSGTARLNARRLARHRLRTGAAGFRRVEDDRSVAAFGSTQGARIAGRAVRLYIRLRRSATGLVWTDARNRAACGRFGGAHRRERQLGRLRLHHPLEDHPRGPPTRSS